MLPLLGGHTKTLFSFFPTDIANLKLWLDAADTSTITDIAGAVSQWDDKSGNNNHATQGVAGARPTTGAVTTNSNNVIQFDGDDKLIFTNPISHTNGYTVFIAPSHGSGDLINKTFVRGDAGSFTVRVDPTNRLDAVRTAQAVLVNGTNPVPTDSQILTAYTSSAGTGIYIGGVDDGNNLTDSALTQPITQIGDDTPISIRGGIGEILIFDRVLNADEMNQIGNYLSTKWGAPWANINFNLEALPASSIDNAVNFNDTYARYHVINQPLPAGDWSIGGWLRNDGAAVTVPFCIGGLGANGNTSNNLYLEHNPIDGRIGLYGKDAAGNVLGTKLSDWYPYAGRGITSNYRVKQGEDVFVTVQKVGAVVQMWLKFKGHAPVLAAEEHTAFGAMTDTFISFGQIISFGRRLTGSMRNWFKVSYSLTKTQIDQIGNGANVETFGIPAATDWRFLMDNVGATWTNELNAITAARYLNNGYSLVTGRGYAPMTDAVFFNPVGVGGYVVQQVDGVATVALSGTYYGADGSDIEIQFFDDQNNGIQEWRTIQSNSSGGVWSGNITLPKGKRWINAQIRKKGSADVMTSTLKWGIGENIILSGQSLMEAMSATTNTSVALNGYVSEFKTINSYTLTGFDVTATANVGGEIELTITPAHGLKTGDKIMVSAIIGTVEANDTVWTVTATALNKVTLDGSVYTNAYISGGTVARAINYTKIANQNLEVFPAPLAIFGNYVSNQSNSVVCVANKAYGGKAIEQFNQYIADNYASEIIVTGYAMGKTGAFLWLHGNSNIGQTGYFSDAGSAGAWTGFGELGKLYDILNADMPNNDFKFGVANFTAIGGKSLMSSSAVHEFRHGMDDWVTRKANVNIFSLGWYNDLQPTWQNNFPENAHLSPTLKGYLSQASRLGHSLSAKLGVIANDGVGGVLVSATKTTNIIDLTFDMNGGSLKTLNDALDITGFEVSINPLFTSLDPIISAKVTGSNTVRLTLAAAPIGAAYIRYQYGYVGNYTTNTYFTPRITGVTDNGAGLIRVTTADPVTPAIPSDSQKVGGHGLLNGQTVGIEGVAGSIQANGVWEVIVIDAYNFDLVGSNSVGLGTFVPNENLWQTGATGVVTVELGNPLYDTRTIADFDTSGAPIAPTYTYITAS